MKIKKFVLTHQKNNISSASLEEDLIFDFYYPQEAKKLAINLIEIETTENPSDLILAITSEEKEKILPLCLFKTKFIFLQNRYSWNTEGVTELIINPQHFSIRVEGEPMSFIMNLYYSTDQNKPYIKFEKPKSFK